MSLTKEVPAAPYGSPFASLVPPAFPPGTDPMEVLLLHWSHRLPCRCCLTVKQSMQGLTEKFKEKDTSYTGWVKARTDGNAEGGVQKTEICSFSLQRYAKASSTLQRSALVEKSSQKPWDRMPIFSNELATSHYGIDGLLRAAGVSISSWFAEIGGCILSDPKACKFLDAKWRPKFILIVAQKNHHTEFFQKGLPGDVPPGTIIYKQICHPRNNDFYMCSHGTPTRHYVLYDKVEFSVDDLHDPLNTLSYVPERSTTAISNVPPICYAHLAASQMGQFIKFDEMTESHGGVTSAGIAPVLQLP